MQAYTGFITAEEKHASRRHLSRKLHQSKRDRRRLIALIYAINYDANIIEAMHKLYDQGSELRCFCKDDFVTCIS